MWYLKFLIPLFLFAASQRAICATDLTEANFDGEGTVQLELNHTNKARVLFLTKISNVYSSSLPPEKESAATTISTIRIDVNGEFVFVPRSVFADIISPKQCTLDVNKDGWILRISGTEDEEGLYTVEIFFDKDQVNKRIVFDGSIKGRKIEETKYSRLLVVE